MGIQPWSTTAGDCVPPPVLGNDEPEGPEVELEHAPSPISAATHIAEFK
jgi:hypothetical protein